MLQVYVKVVKDGAVRKGKKRREMSKLRKRWKLEQIRKQEIVRDDVPLVKEKNASFSAHFDIVSLNLLMRSGSPIRQSSVT